MERRIPTDRDRNVARILAGPCEHKFEQALDALCEQKPEVVAALWASAQDLEQERLRKRASHLKNRLKKNPGARRGGA
jgi:hypothetical protein